VRAHHGHRRGKRRRVVREAKGASRSRVARA
jgi:hypothetical protein